LSVSFLGVGIIDTEDGFAPVFLFIEGSLESDELVVVELEGFSGLVDNFIGGGDEGVESALFVGEGVLLVGQMGGEGIPISSLGVFGSLVVGSGLADGSQNIVEEVDNGNDVF